MSHNVPTKTHSLLNIVIIQESSYDVQIIDDFILVRAASDATINLPKGIIGKEIKIKNDTVDTAYTYTIKPMEGNTIEKMDSYTFTQPLESISLIFVEDNWSII